MARCGLRAVGDGHGPLECSTEHRVEIAVAIDLRRWQLPGIRERTPLTENVRRLLCDIIATGWIHQ